MVVKIENAYYWKCPFCESDNFTRGVSPLERMTNPDDPEEREDLRLGLVAYGICDETEEITKEMIAQLVTVPDIILCSSCDKEFDSISEDE